MSVETALVTLLQQVCPRVYPDVAPATAQLPYITWQHIGGTPLRFLDGASGSLRNSHIQINTWAATRDQSMTLSRAIEDVLCAAPSVQAFVARPLGEIIGDSDQPTDRRSSLQDFSIWGNR